MKGNKKMKRRSHLKPTAETRSKVDSAKEPLVQPVADHLVHQISLADPSVSEGQILVQALRSLTPDQLKSIVNSLPPEQLPSLFRAVPADCLKDFLWSLPIDVFRPKVATPSPSPSTVAPRRILETPYSNPWYDVSNPEWARNVCGRSTVGLTAPPKWEWVPVLEPQFERERWGGSLVGLTGWVCQDPTLSNGDVPFTHPFGFDWEFFIVPDEQYENLLAPGNTGPRVPPGGEYRDATRYARETLGLEARAGVLGLETDQDLVPASFRDWVKDRNRVAAFGRWITDCGHDDFHSEMHAPLLMAVAKPVSFGTSVRIVSRPYTVSQQFEEGHFGQHLVAEVAKVVATNFLGFPLSWRVEAHPRVFTEPYDPPVIIVLFVRPPSARPSPTDTLTLGFHFTHRSGVAVRVFEAGTDTVGVIIVLGIDQRPAPLPPNPGWNISIDELNRLDPGHGGLYEDIFIAELFLNPIAAWILSRGILTDRYDAPIASSPRDNENIALGVQLDALRDPTIGAAEDNDQPFPIYGWLNVGWQPVVEPPPGPKRAAI
jgi:hypothetical protein